MIPQEIIDHLLPFFESPDRRAKQKQIQPNEPDQDLINTSNRLGVTVRITDKKKKRTKGYRFTPVGKSFMFMYVQNQRLKEQVEKTEKELADLKEKLQEKESAPVVQVTEDDSEILNALRDLKRPAWNYLLHEVKDLQVNKKLRRILLALAQYDRKQKT